MRLRRLLKIGLLLTLFWLPSPLAQAHAELVTSNPAVGAHLDAVPSQVIVTFDENLLIIGGPTTNILMVKDPQGSQIDAKNSHVSGASLTVDVNPVVASGSFRVSWRVVSSDGHPVQGSYQFTVGVASASPTPNQINGQATSHPIQKATGEDFWARYGTRVLLLLIAMLAVGIWVRFERTRRKSE